jgi:hypothetical protein
LIVLSPHRGFEQLSGRFDGRRLAVIDARERALVEVAKERQSSASVPALALRSLNVKRSMPVSAQRAVELRKCNVDKAQIRAAGTETTVDN